MAHDAKMASMGLQPHRLFRPASLFAFFVACAAIYGTSQIVRGLVCLVVRYMTTGWIVPIFGCLALGFIALDQYRRSKKPFGSARTWPADIQALAQEAHWLLIRGSHPTDAYPNEAFLRNLNETEIPKSSSDKFRLQDRAFREWKNDYNDHKARLETLRSRYRRWPHFRYPKPSFSLLERPSSDWKHDLVQHEVEIRDLL
jgi:hypothetical protein